MRTPSDRWGTEAARPTLCGPVPQDPPAPTRRVQSLRPASSRRRTAGSCSSAGARSAPAARAAWAAGVEQAGRGVPLLVGGLQVALGPQAPVVIPGGVVEDLPAPPQ